MVIITNKPINVNLKYFEMRFITISKNVLY
jgi:hypothetical protein